MAIKLGNFEHAKKLHDELEKNKLNVLKRNALEAVEELNRYVSDCIDIRDTYHAVCKIDHDYSVKLWKYLNNDETMDVNSYWGFYYGRKRKFTINPKGIAFFDFEGNNYWSERNYQGDNHKKYIESLEDEKELYAIIEEARQFAMHFPNYRDTFFCMVDNPEF